MAQRGTKHKANRQALDRDIEGFLRYFDGIFSTRRIPHGAFSAALFAHMKRTDSFRFVAERSMVFIDYDELIATKMTFREQLWDVVEARQEWSEKEVLFDILLALDPFLEELHAYRAIAEHEPTAEFEHLFSAANYRLLLEAAIRQGLARTPVVGETLARSADIASLMVGLAPVKAGAQVYDPFAGHGSFGRLLSPKIHYHAQEVHATLWAIGMIRLLTVNAAPDLRHEDALTHWAPAASNYDLILLDPPFGKLATPVPEVSFPTRNIETLALQLALNALSPAGKVVALVPERFLFADVDSALRRHMLERNLLHAVISLPQGALQPYSMVKTSILVLHMARPTGAPVRFVDAGAYGAFTRKKVALDINALLNAFKARNVFPGVVDVTTETILADEHTSWSMSRFLAAPGELDPPVSIGRGKTVALAEILADDILSLGDPTGLPLIQVSELSSDILHMSRSAAELKNVSDGKKGTRPLDAKALLIARVGGKLKPTLFDPSKGAVAVGSNVFVFRVLPHADPEYVAMELRSDRVQTFMAHYHQGSSIPSIAKEDLLKVSIPLPDLAEQRRWVKAQKEGILIAKREALAVEEAAHGLSPDEWTILGSVEHSFRPIVSLVEEPMEDIKALLPAMRPEHAERITAALNRMDGGLDRMRGMFQLIHQVIRADKVAMRSLPMDLRRLIKNEVDRMPEVVKRMRIYFHCDPGMVTEQGVVVRVDPEQFKLVVQNLFTNMAKHSFAPARDELDVLISVTRRDDNDRSWTVITIENNGESFPAGFTHEEFITFGKRVDPAKGTGIGGYLIDRIIANHGGRFYSGNVPRDETAERTTFSPDQRLDTNRWDPLDWETGNAFMRVHFTIELPYHAEQD